MDRRRTWQSATLWSLVLASCWVGFEQGRALWTPGGEAERIHVSILSGTALYPHQYRPLMPFLAELPARLGLPLELAYLAWRALFCGLAVLLLRRWLERFVDSTAAFAGAAILAGLLGFATLGQGFQETDPLNLLLFCCAFELLWQRRDGWLFPLVAVGLCNRETIGLVALLAAAARWDEWRRLEYWRLVLGLAATAAMVWLALRLGFGPREPFTELVSPALNLPENLRRAGSLRALLLFGPLWFLAAWRLRSAPPFLARAMVLVPVFLVVHAGWGLLGETRYFLPLAPVVLPLALRHLFDPPESG